MNFKHFPPGFQPQRQQFWTSLAAGTGQADPFGCAPNWQLAFQDSFGPRRRLLLAARGNSQLALAEHLPASGRAMWTPVEAHWTFGSPLLGPEAVDMLAQAVESLSGLYPDPPILVVGGVRPKLTLARRLQKTFGHSHAFYLFAEQDLGQASLDGGLDGYLSRRSANHRSKIRRQAKRAMSEGLTFERLIPCDSAQAQSAYARMLDVESRGWKGQERCGITEPPARRFYAALLRRLAVRGEGRIIFARHAGRDIGFIFGGLAGRIYRGQQFSYDRDWARWSIGNVLQLEQITWLAEEGVRRYDMGPLTGPRMEYKLHWVEKSVTIQTWILVRV